MSTTTGRCRFPLVPPGLLETTTRISRDGIPVLDQEHAWGSGAPTGWDGPAGIGAARVVATVLEVGVVTDRAVSPPNVASLAIQPDVRLHVASGTTVGQACTLLANVEPLPDSLGTTGGDHQRLRPSLL